ncbi:hypothetical protein BDD12DRAFT_898945 [Trichophaea hybrida]|nr:hypothetical protein BDD12DRAFT_898945 [Trichophaea hybrida]
MELSIIAPAASAAGVAAKLAVFAAELSVVEEEISAYQNVLALHERTVESVRSQLAVAQQYLPESEVVYIHQALYDSAAALTSIGVLIDKSLRRMKEEGKVTVKQRFQWVLRDTREARALDKFISNCHTTMVGIDTKLGVQLHCSGRSPARPAVQATTITTTITTTTAVEDDSEFWLVEDMKRKHSRTKSTAEKAREPEGKILYYPNTKYSDEGIQVAVSEIEATDDGYESGKAGSGSESGIQGDGDGDDHMVAWLLAKHGRRGGRYCS